MAADSVPTSDSNSIPDPTSDSNSIPDPTSESIGQLYAIIAHVIETKITSIYFTGFKDAVDHLVKGIRQFQTSISLIQMFTRPAADHLKTFKIEEYCALRLLWQAQVPQYQLLCLTCQGRRNQFTLRFTFTPGRYEINLDYNQDIIKIKLLHPKDEPFRIKNNKTPFTTLEQLVTYPLSSHLYRCFNTDTNAELQARAPLEPQPGVPLELLVTEGIRS